jgi:hypothetical protein
MDCKLDGVVDLTTAEGLKAVGLPETYPIGFQTPAAYVVTQPIGASLNALGSPGLITRSATAAAWDGPMFHWAEVAIFTDHAPTPTVLERLPYASWADG